MDEIIALAIVAVAVMGVFCLLFRKKSAGCCGTDCFPKAAPRKKTKKEEDL